MALTRTSLSAALNATDLIVNVTSATGATVNGFLKIDDEYARITSINGLAITIRRRGDHGGQALAHNVLAPVTFGLQSDLPVHNGPRQWVQDPSDREEFLSLGANGAIPLPVRDTTYVIVKGSALAASLFPNPLTSQDGLLVAFTSATAFAHVITTVDVRSGTTPEAAKTSVTFPAFSGASITLLAQGGRWLVKSSHGTHVFA